MSIRLRSNFIVTKGFAFKLCKGFVFFALLLLIYTSSRHLVSSLYLEQAKQSFRSDNDADKQLLVIVDSLTLLDKSLVWNRYNANALGYKSFVLFEQWQLAPDDSLAENSILLNNAIENLVQAIDQRPNWPFYHIQKAQIYSEFENLDEQFYQSFGRAFELGKYETNTALRLLKIGIDYWFKLSEDYQVKVIELMHLSLQQKSNSPRDLWQLIDANNLGNWFCFKLPESDRRDQMCSYRP